MEEKTYCMRKVVITGPESTGKSHLSHKLAVHFHMPFVKEYSREYLDNLGRNYNQTDLVEIAKRHLKLENDLKVQNPNFLICDTDLLTLKIWSKYKYGSCDKFILNSLKSNVPDLYLLCDIDLPWEFDKQRENPNNREELFYIYENEIKKMNVHYKIISGKGKERFKNALDILNQ